MANGATGAAPVRAGSSDAGLVGLLDEKLSSMGRECYGWADPQYVRTLAERWGNDRNGSELHRFETLEARVVGSGLLGSLPTR